MPRSAWRKEVKQGFDFLRDSTLSIEFPSLESVVGYYENLAPETLPRIETNGLVASASIKAVPWHFQRQRAGWVKNLPPFPATTHTKLVRLTGDKDLSLLVCDTRLDRVLAVRPNSEPPAWELLGPALVPSHAEATDLDGDGLCDVVVACLGQFFPTDDKVGSIVLLRGQSNGTFAPVTILEGLGRVADVQVADFNGDGRLDLVAAVFGWRRTGEILYLENQTSDWSKPAFGVYRVDNRHGAISVPVVDLNKDGRPDFVALISQEHETVVAFLNEGSGKFRPETIFSAPHPTFGCSSIEIADIDGDSDPDVLLTNGDVLDRPYIKKPYHGVQWLENQAAYPFVHHQLTNMYGACKAITADVDNDNDLDIIAVSFLPSLEFPERERLRLPSIVLLEQVEQRKFSLHVLETATCDHFTCAAGDWNSDGQTDLAIGNFSWKRSQPIADAVELFKGLNK